MALPLLLVLAAAEVAAVDGAEVADPETAAASDASAGPVVDVAAAFGETSYTA